MKYNLFLDDERVPHKVTWVSLPMVEWTIVRSYDDFVKIIGEMGCPSIITYDHDLQDKHYFEYHRARQNNEPFDYNRVEKTGYHCAKFLAEYCINNNIPIPEYYVHTMNTEGGENIVSVMESAKKAMFKQISDTLL